MSFENPNTGRAAHEHAEAPKKGRIAHALLSLTNGLIAKKAERSEESGFVIAALEKATETHEAVREFDPDGSLGELAEQGIAKLYKKIHSKFQTPKSDAGMGA